MKFKKKFKIKGKSIFVSVNGNTQNKLVKKAKLSDKGITLEEALKNFKYRRKTNEKGT